MNVKRQIDNQYCLLGAIILLCISPMTQLFHQTNILFHTGNAIRGVIHYQMCVGRGGGLGTFCGGRGRGVGNCFGDLLGEQGQKQLILGTEGGVSYIFLGIWGKRGRRGRGLEFSFYKEMSQLLGVGRSFVLSPPPRPHYLYIFNFYFSSLEKKTSFRSLTRIMSS